MGTANALAADLGLPASPVKAAKMLLNAAPVRVSVGHVFYRDREGGSRSRYFVVAAGIGADALFMSRLDAGLKQRFGYALYVVEAFRLWVTHTYPMFAAHFQENGNPPRAEEVSQILAVRISDFGGVLRSLAPGAAITDHNLHVIALKTRDRWLYLRFMIAVLLRRHTYESPIELVDCESVECCELEGSTEQLFVEADGEFLGDIAGEDRSGAAGIDFTNSAKRLWSADNLVSEANLVPDYRDGGLPEVNSQGTVEFI